MAELMGLVASILGIIQLTGHVAILCRGYVSGVKRASQDMVQLIDELKLLGEVLTVLKDHIDQNSPAGSSALAILASKDGPISGCEGLLRVLQDKLTPRDGFKGMIDSLKWPLKEAETAQCVAQFERHKTFFALAVGVDHITLTRQVEMYVRTTNSVVQDIWAESAEQRMWRLNEEAQNRRRRRVDILNWISSAEFEKKTENKHIETSKRRHPHTGGWFLGLPQFRELVGETPPSPLLWGFGIPGAGKTFVSSVVIDHFLEKAAAENYGVAYFYFEYQEQERQTPIKMLASLVRQLATQVGILPTEMEALYDTQEARGKSPKFEELYTVLVAVFKCFDRVFLVFDALDECDVKTRGKEFLPLLHRMGSSGARLFVTSRQYPEDIWESFHDTATMVEIVPTLEDVGVYVQRRIDEDPRAKRLAKQAKCADRIVSDLTECSQGMFLLARFNVDYICQQTTARKVLTALDKIKTASTTERPLDPTYDRAMQTLRGQSNESIELGLRILTWLVKAKRTLTVDEVKIAVALEPDQLELDELDWADRSTILGVCAGLVVIDETSNTIKLAHYTVQEYLLKKEIIPDDAELTIATACITYLSFEAFGGGACTSSAALEARFREYPFLYYAVTHLTHHLKACDQALTVQLIQGFIGNSAIASAYLQLWYQDVSEGPFPENYDDYPKDRSEIHMAANMGNVAVVQTLLDQGADVAARDSRGWAALDGAAFEGHIEVATLLLENGASCLTQDIEGLTPLHQAIAGESIEMVRLLLERGADHSIAPSDEDTALYSAVLGGQKEIVGLLLENGADSSIRYDGGRTILHVAATEGHVEIVKILLQKGADISSRCDDGYSVLHEAVRNNEEAVVMLLLEMGADKATLNNIGESLLHSAALGGCQEVACLLLEHGADVSIIDMQGETIIHEAAWGGHDRLVQLLIANGTDCSVAEKNGFTVLHVAAMQGYVNMGQQILERDVDISAVDVLGNTALLWAASQGHLAFVQLLLDAGADMSIASEDGITPLDSAVSFGAADVVELLLKRGADVFAVDKDGLTALHQAALAGDPVIVQMLLDSGADVAAVNRRGETPRDVAASVGSVEVVDFLDRLSAEGGGL